jgi:hypothetical protein
MAGVEVWVGSGRSPDGPSLDRGSACFHQPTMGSGGEYTEGLVTLAYEF